MSAFSADTSEFHRLAASVKDADKEIRKDLFQAMSRATRPVKKEIPESAKRTLPGGLGEWAAKAKVTTRQAYSGTNIGVTIQTRMEKTRTSRAKATKGQKVQNAGTFGAVANLKALDEGKVWHPVWGRRLRSGRLAGPQSVEAGYFTSVMETLVARRAEKEILAALRAAVDRITGSRAA